jgi:hypothetical protein
MQSSEEDKGLRMGTILYLLHLPAGTHVLAPPFFLPPLLPGASCTSSPSGSAWHTEGAQ